MAKMSIEAALRIEAMACEAMPKIWAKIESGETAERMGEEFAAELRSEFEETMVPMHMANCESYPAVYDFVAGTEW